MDNDLYIKLKPVCDCGYVFNNIKITAVYKPVYMKKCVIGKTLTHTLIEPNKCPKCGKIFKGISLDRNSTIEIEEIHEGEVK